MLNPFPSRSFPSLSFPIRAFIGRFFRHGTPGALCCLGLLVTAHGGERGSQPIRKSYAAAVTRVFDGDTLWVRPLDGGRHRKLRLEGVDAPEICQAGGVASRDALMDMVSDQVVSVEELNHDRYGRALVRLHVEGEDVSASLVVQGLAWSYRWRNSLGPYAAEEARARLRGRGIFSDPGAELPRDFRRRHGPCRQS